MEDKKKKYAYWMRPSMVEEMESMLSEANAMSKSEFVCQAVEFYMAYLRQNKSLEFFSPLLAQTIKTEVESVERHISEMLFKVAVEQSIQNNLTAAFNEVDEDTVARLRNSCAGEVVRLNGVVAFEDAYTGRKMYGYLPRNMKQTVDAIVAGLAKDERIAELYAEWNKANREKLSVYYDKPKPDIPLEDNKEFRDIKNAVLRSAVLILQSEQQEQPVSVTVSVGSLILQLAKAIAASCQKRRMKLDTQIDSKLKSRIERKKQAHGLKTDRSVQMDHSEDEEGMHLSI